ncbi:protein arginine methyltransferase NDUFAF7, mitochondrial [Anoplophora glabripennis]|uniref:protein arginine methyltransferase NDUFAF7, mitochondrial n=1 Tax=Anoplophora glabripennis TaxID=217634 RepID=UPI000874E64C|nr:protein arginine methyltransferase NDUFAF7, mitochondrial [Anoplophora glabripennis]XP_018568374.1 protein arginine methyltransferase NDUFAF7, mitochondrial [Anoplophora glabripennis]
MHRSEISKLNMILSRVRHPKFTVKNFTIVRTYYNVKRKVKVDEDYLAKHIHQKIRAKGPVTVAEYMKEVLTNPMAGYYMHKDMFGDTGDFVTSPEITQMFGEIIAVWFLNEWQKMGSPKPVQIVELGPGRGTLCNDILRVFSHFKALHKASLHLVEISPTLSEVQAKQLCNETNPTPESDTVYKRGMSHHGIPVFWHKQLEDVPHSFSLIVAHEFFDALPIHKFHKTFNGYKEVLIDIDCDETTDSLPKFRYTLARNETPMSKLLVKPDETREHVEISPDSIAIFRTICERVKFSGGIALVCDYGHNGTGTDTFRAFKKHQQVDPLVLPGTADLTADVDFSLLRNVANEVDGVITLGPSTQKNFLLKTGLEYRFKALARNIEDKDQLENLTECYNFLVDEEKMGERFKFCALFPETARKILNKAAVVGFSWQ